MSTHVYIAEQSKGLNFTVEVEDEKVRVRFVDGQFKTDDGKLAKAIDRLRKKNPGIKRRCRKADIEAAEKMAREHRQMLARTGAMKGGITADAIKRSMSTALEERDIELRSKNIDVDEFADANLQLTEAVVNPPDNTEVDPMAEGIGLGLEVAALDSQKTKEAVAKKEIKEQTPTAKSIKISGK